VPVQNAICGGSQRLLADLDHGGTLGAGDGARQVWQSPPVPLPDGTSRAGLERAFCSWSVNGEPVGHLDAYVDDFMWRFLHTWEMVRDDIGDCLELGANPYFTTYLPDEHTKLELTLANYYGQRGETSETLSLVPPGRADRVEVGRRLLLFNIEEDRFPFDDNSFDLVPFCEMVEHLLMDPVGALRQIHRVLKPGGIRIVTTPKVCRLDNALTHGQRGQHLRPVLRLRSVRTAQPQYNRHELHRLLEFAGFDVDYSLSADGHPTDHTRGARFYAVAPWSSSAANTSGTT
jgi:SAM-dependent methyltransferase